jgi:predicted branched-subunit amino acid permease
VRAIAPIAPMAAIFAASFGVLATATGMGTLAPIVMSATTFAGSAQFAAASVIGSGGALAAIGAAGLLNARYAPISLTVAPTMSGSLLSRLLQSQLIVDESWAVSRRDDGRYDRRLLVGAGLVLYACWNVGTVVGVLAGDVVGEPSDFGLDAAFAALFLAILVPQVRSRRALAAAVLGGTIALALIPFAAAGVPIVAAAAACLIGWRKP